MTTWTAPITFTSTTLTAAQMNTEVRDHLNFLKGALDILTASTTADTGTAMNLSITRGSTGLAVFSAAISGDTVGRLVVTSDGQLQWGNGAGAADVVMYRTSADHLRTDDFLEVGAAGMWFAPDGLTRIQQRADPGASAANQCYFYARDNGSGKMQLCVQFPSGAVQVLATQP